MELIFSPLAEQDLEEIGDYIALDNPISGEFSGSNRQPVRKAC